MATLSDPVSSEKGFSIRCPHCFNWSDWHNRHPSDLVASDGEWSAIVEGLKNYPETFSHPKLLCCQHHPHGGCPVPFQALVCANQETAHGRRVGAPSWSTPHAFRVHDLTHVNRHEYSAVLFSARSVRRHRHIELDSLLDRELLSRSVLGMSYELNAPITIFTPRFLEAPSVSEEIWIPIEAYDHEQRPVPPHFNLFCDICREAFLTPIMDECEAAQYSATTCPLGCGERTNGQTLCSGKTAACSFHPVNWTQCPAFLRKRAETCRCYDSDLALISKTKETWSRDALDRNSCVAAQCWAGLQERAMPIIVHDHLAGIAMTGQFILQDRLADIDVDRIVEETPLLRPHRRRLKRVWSLVTGHAEPQNGLEHYTMRFVVSASALREVEERFAANVHRIADSANVQYRHNRARRESAFREEMLGRIAAANGNAESPGLLLTLLERMREFWAFCGVYWFTWNGGTKWLNLVAKAQVASNGPALLNSPIRIIDHDIEDVNCHPWLYRRQSGAAVSTTSGPQHANLWIQDFQSAYEAISPDVVPELAADGETSHFLVFIKHGWAVHAIVFAERDGAEVSPLRPADKGSISPICQHAIADTCEAVVRALIASDTLNLLQWQRKILTVDAIGTTVVHELRTVLVETRNSFDSSLKALEENGQQLTGSDLTKMSQSLNKCLTVVKRVNQYKRSGKIEFRSVALHGLVMECVSDALLLSRGIVPEVDIPSHARVWADEFLLSVAIRNLLKNVKDQNRNGQTRVTALRIGYGELDEGLCRITVTDDGPGYSFAALAGFYALQNGGFVGSEYDKAGLGLLISKAILDLHKGVMHIRNVPSGGARVEIELCRYNR